MPISLAASANSKATAKNAYSPKYFSPVLTGYYTAAGKIAQRGILNENADPSQAKPGAHRLVRDDVEVRRRTVTSGGVTTNLIPVSLVPSSFWTCVTSMPVPDLSQAIPIATQKTPSRDRAAYLALDVHSIVHEQERGVYGNQQRLRVTWRLGLWVVDHDATGDAVCSTTGSLSSASCVTGIMLMLRRVKASQLIVTFDADVSGAVDHLVKSFVSEGWDVDADAVRDAYERVHTLDSVSRASHDWQTSIDTIATEAIDRLVDFGTTRDDALAVISDMMHRLESYPVSLAFYRPIYDALAAKVTDTELSQLVKNNLNLLLTDTMRQLEVIKPRLNRLPDTATATVDPFFSPEQAAAIASHEPLVLIQSVAGSGKSSTIRGRIHYMIDAGVDPHDITVLSFTNAAADHIREIAPDVNSMTIASMVHTIYAANFNHELSSIPTLLNALDIWFPHNTLAINFKHYLRAVAANETSAFTQLNNFVELNYEGIVNLLDTCGQTTLELEIILCYQHIGDYVEPPEVTSQHLIVDEVQDNSIFEFVYTLKYISKHLNSLYIVGDASQTLFEFRASNPRALNIMEASGVFATYKLQTNYRSNQDILDFANLALADIEANQFANLRLRSNDLTPVTQASFADHVRLQCVRVAKQAEFAQNAPNYVRLYLKPYIDECFARGEHVCFLAHSRFDVRTYQRIFEDLYPDRTIMNIAPQKGYDVTVLSSYIARDWVETQFFDRHAIVDQMQRYLDQNIERYLPRRARKYAQDAALDTVRDWAQQARPLMTTLVSALDLGRINETEFYDRLKQNMIEYEIRMNAVRQNVVSQRNRERKEALDPDSVDIVVSTIHSAKGLEFENVIVAYHETATMTEADKRMYYVALTRAMRSELILAWSTNPKPVIGEAYQNLYAALDPNATTAASTEVNGS